jgi:hypothetical protein
MVVPSCEAYTRQKCAPEILPSERGKKMLAYGKNILLYYEQTWQEILERATMAKITFSLEELVKFLISNGFLPASIVRAKVKGERIHFIIRTNSFILPFIPASLGYLSFENNRAMFELTIVSNRLNKSISWLDEAFKLKIPSYVKLEYPNLSVDVDKLLTEKNLRGVRVKDIFFEDGEFAIVTGNA